MKLIWVSVRKASDLCSTTTYSLLDGLSQRGHEITFLSPKPFDENTPWTNIELQQSTVKGFHASSLAASARDWFKALPVKDNQCVVIDWPLASKLGAHLNKSGHRVLLMDRSPPADPSIFGRLQWRHWKRAWSMVDRGVFSDGFVVSEAHASFAGKYCRRGKCIHILPAGVDTELFQPNSKPTDLQAPSFVYHGRLDKHRGVLALPLLIQRLRTSGKSATLTLIGEGDAERSLQNIADDNSWISIIGTLEKKELASQLASHDIGLLPMPDSTVWRLASPLKRSEYLSSGLLVYGIEHAGNRLSIPGEDWMKLVDRSLFHEACEPWIDSLANLDISQLKSSARSYALNQLNWSGTVDVMEQLLTK
jgi:glycosyltransferase involved in cell wall biosynthesis